MSGKHPKHIERTGVDLAGRTPLHYAANERDVVKVRAMLKAGANPAAPDDDLRTPLHLAAKNNAADIAKLLLDAGAPVDPRDGDGNTPLSNAVFASRGDGALIALLRSRGADPFSINDSGVSPVALARTIANYDVRQFFVDLAE